MQLTKLGHSCVRLRKDDRTLVIDPGGLTPEDDAITGAEAVLITHEHFDHLEAERLRRALVEDPRLTVYTCRAVADILSDVGDRVRTVGEGDAFTVAGFDVAVVGQKHEIVHPDVPPVENVGFLIDEEVFHPGDAFTVVRAPTLLVPGQAPWMKAPEMIQYLREVSPRRAYAVHDGLLNDAGLGLLESQLSGEGKRQDAEFRRLKPGESVPL
ncbi:MBL fold metallo-hydrolase [Actinoallomurus iriomotensis]|uniref:MBL fold metallo-hydrolase n=1 Tax=Actinoallomurus iriomotensis TaxID=478107 RepID=A0A9W6SD44_9ACTN|nr:MBL fold metallo-hydrolase [Actinoallomurus iriomotensis]GLY91394.1 MBL fold metallo-hydrolase [Actinoallomurus iriomotensis]